MCYKKLMLFSLYIFASKDNCDNSEIGQLKFEQNLNNIELKIPQNRNIWRLVDFQSNISKILFSIISSLIYIFLYFIFEAKINTINVSTLLASDLFIILIFSIFLTLLKISFIKFTAMYIWNNFLKTFYINFIFLTIVNTLFMADYNISSVLNLKKTKYKSQYSLLQFFIILFVVLWPFYFNKIINNTNIILMLFYFCSLYYITNAVFNIYSLIKNIKTMNSKQNDLKNNLNALNNENIQISKKEEYNPEDERQLCLIQTNILEKEQIIKFLQQNIIHKCEKIEETTLCSHFVYNVNYGTTECKIIIFNLINQLDLNYLKILEKDPNNIVIKENIETLKLYKNFALSSSYNTNECQLIIEELISNIQNMNCKLEKDPLISVQNQHNQHNSTLSINEKFITNKKEEDIKNIKILVTKNKYLFEQKQNMEELPEIISEQLNHYLNNNLKSYEEGYSPSFLSNQYTSLINSLLLQESKLKELQNNKQELILKTNKNQVDLEKKINYTHNLSLLNIQINEMQEKINKLNENLKNIFK